LPILWNFRCYLSPSGVDEIRFAHDSKGRQTRKKFLSRLTGLAQLPFEQWNDKLYKDLHGDCVGLGEIRFFSDKVQQRPIGFRSGPNEFTILHWAEEIGGKWVPRSTPMIAQGRKAEILKDRDRADAIWLALE
jgi:hypothetical protein